MGRCVMLCCFLGAVNDFVRWVSPWLSAERDGGVIACYTALWFGGLACGAGTRLSSGLLGVLVF